MNQESAAPDSMMATEPSLTSALLAGALAGTSVDIALFPLDTVKTRLQSTKGFWGAGGFRGIYSGLPSAAVGSAPSAALFFLTYEAVKAKVQHHGAGDSSTTHMLAASCGEVAACVVRVPVEVIKQRAQAGAGPGTLDVLRATLRQEGAMGLYRGYFSTVIREVPFSLVQFPLWEYLKRRVAVRQGTPTEPWQSALCGVVAGGTAAAITTPLDVAKTRIMLAQHGTVVARGGVWTTLGLVYRERGPAGLFAGMAPRVLWISIGGAIFLGVYDKAKSVLSKRNSSQH